ncbi:hypothetical protein LINPERHAP1_LOCUS2946 [Linum perenne]
MAALVDVNKSCLDSIRHVSAFSGYGWYRIIKLAGEKQPFVRLIC